MRLLALLLLAACGGGTGGSSPDAQVSSSPDAATGCNVVFLEFDSVHLTPGPDDAPNNASSMINAPKITPGFHAGDATRDADIATITAQVSSTLGSLGVAVVTTRPASGAYSMVVIGGTSAGLGLGSGLPGLAPFSGCGIPVANRITYAFENAGGAMFPDEQVADLAIGGYLVGLGVPTSSDTNDCLCWDSPSCQDASACTLGGAQTPRYQSSACGSGATFDEPSTLAAALACP